MIHLFNKGGLYTVVLDGVVVARNVSRAEAFARARDLDVD